MHSWLKSHWHPKHLYMSPQKYICGIPYVHYSFRSPLIGLTWTRAVRNKQWALNQPYQYPVWAYLPPSANWNSNLLGWKILQVFYSYTCITQIVSKDWSRFNVANQILTIVDREWNRIITHFLFLYRCITLRLSLRTDIWQCNRALFYLL